MIGHMILRKNIDGEDILGLKIVGGKTLSSSQKGAVIEKVKRGSIADQEGHLKPGKTSKKQEIMKKKLKFRYNFET
jgi:regulating synaptic membrane exocytosis protein 2